MPSPSSHSTPAGPSLDPADLAWLKRLAWALLRDEAGAEDLVQDTLVAAWESPPGDLVSRRGWLRAVARRLAARRHRDAIRRRDHERLGAREEIVRSSDDLAAAAEAAEQVARAARRLDEPFRRTILQHYLEELSANQIAARTGEKVDTVRWRLRRGLELMREDLQRGATSGGADRRWVHALLPLTLLPGGSVARLGGRAAGTLAGSSTLSTLTALSALTLSMKLLLATFAAFACMVGYFLLRTSDTGALSQPPPAIQREGSQPTVALEIQPEIGPVSQERVAALPEMTPASQVAVSAPVVTQLRGRVLDERGGGVEGATVFPMDPHADQIDGSTLPPRVTSGRRGEFSMEGEAVERWLARHDGAVRIAALANGFLRSDGVPIERGVRSEGIEITLDEGLAIEGRVQSESGQDVRDLLLLAHMPFVNSDSLSVTRVVMNGARRSLSPPADWPYSQCLSRTSANGSVTFRGLETGSCTVRSLDPSWEIVAPRSTEAGSQGVVWIAARRFGVHLVATRSGAPLRGEGPGAELDVPAVSSVFRVELRFADGRELDTGQWLGSGGGEVMFALTPELVPDVEFAEIDGVRFYGSASLDGESLAWTAPLIERRDLDAGAPRVLVDFPQPAARTARATDPSRGSEVRILARDARVELDVRYRVSGAPFDGALSVSWERAPQDPDEGGPASGGVRGERQPSGRYLLRVPAGEIRLEVQAASASGSLPAWSGLVTCTARGTTALSVELEEGGTALIQRPAAWSGEWFVRASYRAAPADPWFGSWSYSTADDELRLESLVPAEWRFELRRRRSESEPGEIRMLRLVEGDLLEVR